MQIKPIFDLNDKSPERLIQQFQELPSTGNSGGRITYISESLDHLKLTLPLNDKTQNFMGITSGGCMYSATDAIYLCLLWYRLGEAYMLIDKSASIEYLRPGLSDLSAEFFMPESEIELIKNSLATKKSITRDYCVDLTDNKGKTVCRIHKSIYIRKAPQAINT